jgi:hypothetical protein
MVSHRSLVVVAAVLLVGCALPRPVVEPGPSGLRRVVVETPVNETGSDLVVAGPDPFARLIGEQPSTVPDVLGDELRTQLERRGFRLAEGTAGDAPVLRTQIRRWEPYAADYSMVTVDIDAALVEPGSGRTLWRATRTGWNVRTYDARSRADASMIASAAAAEALLAGWQPVAR